jgi:hypothetical protein
LLGIESSNSSFLLALVALSTKLFKIVDLFRVFPLILLFLQEVHLFMFLKERREKKPRQSGIFSSQDQGRGIRENLEWEKISVSLIFALSNLGYGGNQVWQRSQPHCQ